MPTIITRFTVSDTGMSNRNIMRAHCEVSFGNDDSFLTADRKAEIASALKMAGLMAPSTTFDYQFDPKTRTFIVSRVGISFTETLHDVRTSLESEASKVYDFVQASIKRWQEGDIINKTIDPLLHRDAS